ncbi:MAG: hypothetical protein ACI8V2_004613 [Candidatus Latescibacterota bacterium]|jgi:hypothetical protein
MMTVRPIVMVTLLSLLSCPATASGDNLWSTVLSAFVDRDGFVNYAGLKAQPQSLDAFVSQLATQGPRVTPEYFTTRSDSLSFWLNAYNALVVFGVKTAYPIASVRDILPNDGFFKQQTFVVDGQNWTLDQIEHTILRGQFKDPRIHAAINCGARSCPKLNLKPFTARTLGSQLEDAMRQLVRSPNHVRFDSHTKTLYLSQIFAWFKSDFTQGAVEVGPKTQGKLVDYIASFLTDENRKSLHSISDLQIVFQAYDWSLNDQASSQ